MAEAQGMVTQDRQDQIDLELMEKYSVHGKIQGGKRTWDTERQLRHINIEHKWKEGRE